MFDLALNSIVSWIKTNGYTSVALQLPEGLKIRATEISDFITGETGVDVIVLGYPCYGACDLFVDYGRYADALVHFGHSPIPSQGSDPNVMYVEAFSDADVSESLLKVVDSLPDRLGLLATVQYVKSLPKVKEILEGHGKSAVIGKGDTRIFYPGQVLGCNCSSALSVEDEVDAFLFLGEGDFHPLAAAFGVQKPVIILNPITGELRTVDDVRDRILRKRFAAIESARPAKSFMVIVCSKVGQNRMSAAKDIADKLRKAGKDVSIAIMDEISPIALMAYRAEAFVNTACPRVAMDDSVRYDRPLLTIPEAEIVLGLRTWDEYKFDSI